MIKHWMVCAVCTGGVLLLSGCLSVGPDYESPETTLPDAWHAAVQDEFSHGTPTLQSWWSIFNDAALDRLIDRAAENNRDLKAAASRIEQAAALRGVEASRYWPDISASGSASAVRNTAAATPAGVDREGELYQAGLTMAWELDLWGRIRRSVESADASMQASVENYRDLLVLLYADVAAGYINVRTLQERIRYAEENRAAQAETLRLTQKRYDAGLVPALDVAQSTLNLSRTESTIPPLRQRLVEEINRLSVLTGAMPFALQEELQAVSGIPASTNALAIGVPTELLRQRPDIRRAERELAAQHARIGATQAELYPTLTLPGTLAVESDDSDLFTGANTLYRFGPQLRWSLFNGRRIRSQVRAEEAATQAALHSYEQTLLLALEEVEDAMSAYVQEKERLQSLETAAAAAEKSVALVTELYTSGLTDFQNVLNMEQALLVQQDAMTLSRGLISTYLVSVYKALGGGWDQQDMPE